jgi:hypothetical protein
MRSSALTTAGGLMHQSGLVDCALLGHVISDHNDAAASLLDEQSLAGLPAS